MGHRQHYSRARARALQGHLEGDSDVHDHVIDGTADSLDEAKEAAETVARNYFGTGELVASRNISKIQLHVPTATQGPHMAHSKAGIAVNDTERERITTVLRTATLDDHSRQVLEDVLSGDWEPGEDVDADATMRDAALPC